MTDTAQEEKFVLIIDDDSEFVIACMRELSLQFRKLENPHLDIPTFLKITNVEQLEKALSHQSAHGEIQSIAYALVDYRLPTTAWSEDTTKEMEENGKKVLHMLEELQVPVLLMSIADRELVDDQVLHHKDVWFVPKKSFTEEAPDIARRLLANLEGANEVKRRKARLRVIRCPNGKRCQTRILPLAFESKSMTDIVNAIQRGTFHQAAATLLVGEEGVEFEQVAWLLFESLSKKELGSNRSMRFEILNGRGMPEMEDVINRLEEALDADSHEPLFVFLENTQALSGWAVTRLVHHLENAISLGPGKVRLALMGSRIEIDERIQDLFALAGSPDFFTIEIPPLSRRREDISPYLDYYLEERNRGESTSYLKWGSRTHNVLAQLQFHRNFKDLAIQLEALFRNSRKGVITIPDIRRIIEESDFFSTISQQVVERILRSEEVFARLEEEGELAHEAMREDAEQLKSLCAQMISARKRMSEEMTDEDDRMHQDLKRIYETIATIEGLSSDPSVLSGLEQLDRFWPLERYPFCSSLLKELEKNGYTVGIRPLRTRLPEGVDLQSRTSHF
ncbi:MAG: hypothetical protein AAF604_01825 [Acidobacteriota bacterium]